MNDEFTANMHANMLGWSHEDTVLICVYVAIRKGAPNYEACQKYGISEDYYDENIEQAKERCFNLHK